MCPEADGRRKKWRRTQQEKRGMRKKGWMSVRAKLVKNRKKRSARLFAVHGRMGPFLPAANLHEAPEPWPTTKGHVVAGPLSSAGGERGNSLLCSRVQLWFLLIPSLLAGHSHSVGGRVAGRAAPCPVNSESTAAHTPTLAPNSNLSSSRAS